MAEMESFLEEVKKGIRICIKVSKVEENKFRYTGLDVKRHSDGFTVSMNDYVNSFTAVKDIRKEPGITELTKLQLKRYRKM